MSTIWMMYDYRRPFRPIQKNFSLGISTLDTEDPVTNHRI